MASLRPGLRWLLLGTVGVSAAALLWPEGEATRIIAVASRGADLERVVPSTVPTSSTGVVAAPIPFRLPAHLLEKAQFDPFAGGAPAPAPTPIAPAASKPFVGPVYVPPPPAPSLNYRYLGQILDPDGRRLVYLARPDKDVLVGAGTRLDEGYVVEAIDDQGVRLRYPPLDAHAVVPSPTAHDPIATGPTAAHP